MHGRVAMKDMGMGLGGTRQASEAFFTGDEGDSEGAKGSATGLAFFTAQIPLTIAGFRTRAGLIHIDAASLSLPCCN